MLLLATTDDEATPQRGVRFATIATMVIAAIIADPGAGWQHSAVIAIAGGAFLVLVCYEFVKGYRTSRTGGAADLDT